MQEIQSVVVGPPPPTATITGTGDGGEGVIKKQLVQTPMGQPDQVTAYIPTVVALFVRFASVFFQTLGGLVTAQALGILDTTGWKVALLAALSVAVVNLIISLGAVFANLEKRFPLVSQVT